MNRAFRLLQSNPKATLIALGMTKFWLAHDGLRLDVAPFIAALEHATGREALVLGKPDGRFFHAAVERLGLPAHEIVMIGDGIKTDVEGAQKAGLKGALVRTGKFRDSDLQGRVIPDAVLDSIADLPAGGKKRDASIRHTRSYRGHESYARMSFPRVSVPFMVCESATKLPGVGAVADVRRLKFFRVSESLFGDLHHLHSEIGCRLHAFLQFIHIPFVRGISGNKAGRQHLPRHHKEIEVFHGID